MDPIIEAEMRWEHYEKYRKQVERLPADFLESLARAVRVSTGKTDTTMLDSYTEDRHLNNIRLSVWDGLCGLLFGYRAGLSHAEQVCILKHIAVYHIARVPAPVRPNTLIVE